MIKQSFKILFAILVVSFAWDGCTSDKKNVFKNSVAEVSHKDSLTKYFLDKFSLFYPENLQIDSNSLIFYCFRSYDTSSLIHITKNGENISGAFYEILPTYHRFAEDFADQNAKLQFFEGYSFVIDSILWKEIQENAEKVLAVKDTINQHDRYTDESIYGLYYNSQSSFGKTTNGFRFEKFDEYLKVSFLGKFMQARKPIMHKVK